MTALTSSGDRFEERKKTMCKYCERRKDTPLGHWDQPALPYHGNTLLTGLFNLGGNALQNEKWDGFIYDYQTSQPELILKCPGYFNGEGVGTICIPIKFCPECGRKLGKSIWEKRNK